MCSVLRLNALSQIDVRNLTNLGKIGRSDDRGMLHVKIPNPIPTNAVRNRNDDDDCQTPGWTRSDVPSYHDAPCVAARV